MLRFPSGLLLAERTYYLAQSLASAKSASSVGADDVEFIQRIQDGMDVALIQGEVLTSVRTLDGLGGDEKDGFVKRLDGVLLDLDQVSESLRRLDSTHREITAIRRFFSTIATVSADPVDIENSQSTPRGHV
jgi:hypothetical protein